jgi:hypothetical protein
MEYAIAANLTMNGRLYLGSDLRLRHPWSQILEESLQANIRNSVCLTDSSDFFWSFS